MEGTGMDTPSTPSTPHNQLVTKVKALLTRAWRERWNEIHWGIHLKKTLNTTQGDVREIAELLLQQALVGIHPNDLILSYLKHAVFSQVIPPSAAFKFIIGFDDFTRPFCFLRLIELAQEFAVNISFSCGLDRGLTLCKTLQNVLHWLLTAMLKFLQKFQENGQQEFVHVLDTAATAVQKIMASETVKGLLYVARSEDIELYRELEQTELNVRGTMSKISMDAISSTVRQNVAGSLTSLSLVQEMNLPLEPVLELTHLPVCPTIITLVALETVLNPTSEVQPFVDQIVIVEKLMKLPRPYLFCELFRACYMGLLDSQEAGAGGHEEMKWAAFTFLKLPQVLLKIQQQLPSPDFTADLEKGFDKLLKCIPMLDLTDVKCNCDILQFLLIECKRASLMSETQYNRLMQRRTNESQKPRASETPNPQPCASLIIRAEPTVTSILKTLEADITKNQENLLGVLCHMLSGKSFELILAAAAATGKLQSFATKLIKFNEYSKVSSGDSGKASQTRALLFDISFLMLCQITQVYGTDLLLSSADNMDVFFIQWALRCLPEDGKYKSVENNMPVDTNKVDALLSAITSGGDLTQGAARWHDICTNLPYAIQEVLLAWEHGALSSDNIKSILNFVKARMCCLPIVISAWLCSYINMLSEEARGKPQSILHQLTQVAQPDAHALQYYMERSHLMMSICHKMTADILPASKRSAEVQLVPANSLPSEVMAASMHTVFSKGWLDLKNLHTLESLINLCGTDWFADRLVKHMLESNRPEELCQCLSQVFAVAYMDLEHMTLSLLLHTIPSLLLSADKQTLLTDPRGYTLAKLCVLCITAAQNGRTGQKDSTLGMYRRGRKRSRKEFDLEQDLDEFDARPTKRSKSMETQITLDFETFNFDLLNSKDEGECSPTIEMKDPLSRALINLYRLMNAIVHDRKVSPRLSFIVSFIDEAVKCGPQYSRYILQFMPPNMLTQLMKCLPGVFSNKHVIQICDLSSTTGRKLAAKAICQNSRLPPLD